MISRRDFLRAAPAALFISACGSGSAPPAPYIPPPTPAPQRNDLLFGYYYGSELAIVETRGHANLQWIPPGSIAETVRLVALAAPQRVVLMLPDSYLGGVFRPGVVDHARALLAAIDPARIAALYPEDEPSVSAEEIRRGNAALRTMMAGFGVSIPLAVIYGANGPYPGIETYDWVGLDNYEYGANVLTRYAELHLRPEQRTMLVPGGADPWRQDPRLFLEYANANPQVVAIIAFIWLDFPAPGVGRGIRSNGLAPAYVAAAQAITAPGAP